MKTMAQLTYHFGMKFRFYPSQEQKEIIKANSDASRFVYNEMVAIDKELFQLKQVKIPIKLVQDRIQQLQERKNMRQLANHYVFLNDPKVLTSTKSMSARTYQAAWNIFRKVHHAGVPKFHKKGSVEKYQSAGVYGNNGFMPEVAYLTNGSVCYFLDKHHVNLPKLGTVRVSGVPSRIWNRQLKGIETRIGTTTITKDLAGHYTISMQLASDTPFVKSLPKANSQIGIDLNLDNFLMDNEGNEVPNPRYYRTIKKKLAKAQRRLGKRLTRAKKEHRPLAEAKNYQKQRLVVNKIHQQVKNQRRTFLDQLSITLVKNHDLVVAEELRSSNLLKNHALAMSISDVGWRTFLQMLTYKANLYSRQFITINPKNTTQRCSDCGFVMGTEGTTKLTLAQREWTCPKCHTYHVRDQNAAKNILNKGLELLTAIK